MQCFHRRNAGIMSLQCWTYRRTPVKKKMLEAKILVFTGPKWTRSSVFFSSLFRRNFVFHQWLSLKFTAALTTSKENSLIKLHLSNVIKLNGSNGLMNPINRWRRCHIGLQVPMFTSHPIKMPFHIRWWRDTEVGIKLQNSSSTAQMCRSPFW